MIPVMVKILDKGVVKYDYCHVNSDYRNQIIYNF